MVYGTYNPKTKRYTAERTYYENYVEINPNLIEYVDILASNYSYYEKPYPEDDLEQKFTDDIVVEMYSFYPSELLKEIGLYEEKDKAISKMLTVANDISYYSREETDGGDKFEYALEDAFNLFIDVEAKRVGGAGNIDIECIYITDESNKKFDIEAKSTKNKTIQINARRLSEHRKMVNSRYTLLVTPNYAKGVLLDIEKEKIIIIKASCLANYMYQYITKVGRNISYNYLEELSLRNFGNDISDKINEYVYDNFGYIASDISVKQSVSVKN